MYDILIITFLFYCFALQFNELKIEPLSPSLGEDIKFNSDVSDLDHDFMMQWNIESCFENGNIGLGVLLSVIIKNV